MTTTILKRFLSSIPTIFGVSIVVFLMLSATGDPTRFLVAADAPYEEIQAVRRELRLDKPAIVRYGFWLRNVVTKFDFGVSYWRKTSVGAELLKRLPNTLELAATTMCFALLIAIGTALLSVRKPGGKFDSTARTVIFVFLAMPAFWLGIELIIIFSRRLQWLPPAGIGSGTLGSHIRHLILPAITLGLGTAALLTRVLRASMLEVLHSDFVRTARAKGLSGRAVLIRHTLRNALIPFITLSGLSIAALLEGSIIVESIFSWPGIGTWMVEGIKGRDAPVVMAGVLMAAVCYTLVNLTVDILYTVADPRIRLEGGK